MHQNNFHLIRLIAALQVAFVHAVEWLKIPVPQEILYMVGLFPGVTIFFAISGYLIADSYLRSPDSYAVNRALRIYPALWVCFGVSLVIAWYFGQLEGVGFGKIAPWALGQLTFVQYSPDFLQGFGTGAMNGVLWTIMVELQFYVLLPFILSFVGRSRTRFALIFITALVVGVTYLYLRAYHFGSAAEKGMLRLVLSWLYVFLVGVFLRLNSRALDCLKGNAGYILLGYFAIVLIVGERFTVTGNDATPLTTIPLALLTISAGYTVPWLSKRLLGANDISYGLYIYHMLVINIFVHTGQTGQWGHLLFALGISVAIAFASWIAIERPALALKKRRSSAHVPLVPQQQ